MSVSASFARPFWRVAVVGFGSFERQSLASFFRLAEARSPAYRGCEDLAEADLVIADADQLRALTEVRRAGREADAVFVGARPPAGAVSWLTRPIEPTHIVRELDALVARRIAALEAEADTQPTPLDALDAPPPSPVPPLPAATPAPAPEPSPAPPPVLAHGPGAGRRVLVVDDSPIARTFLKLRLERLGYRVDTAADADEALAAARMHGYAIVFLDVVLGEPPNADGLVVCQALKQADDPPGAVVLASGLSNETDKVRGVFAGADAYLTKPLMEDLFLATLRQVDPAFAAPPAFAG